MLVQDGSINNPYIVVELAPISLGVLALPSNYSRMSSLPQFYLPDPLAQWPWPRKLSEHYTEVKPESDEWLRSFEALDAKSQRSFDLCNFCESPFIPYFYFRVLTKGL